MALITLKCSVAGYDPLTISEICVPTIVTCGTGISLISRNYPQSVCLNGVTAIGEKTILLPNRFCCSTSEATCFGVFAPQPVGMIGWRHISRIFQPSARSDSYQWQIWGCRMAGKGCWNAENKNPCVDKLSRGGGRVTFNFTLIMVEANK